jgi:hypothetical protein
MQPVDLVARAEIAQLKVRLHQMTTALFMAVDALDMALKASERVASMVSPAPEEPGGGGGESAAALRQARAQILNMRLLLR